MYILGFDIGGTKCAAVTASWDGERIELLKKEAIPTDREAGPCVMIERLFSLAEGILEGKPDSIGISCGGPLDSERGVIMSPPNLPGWDNIEITRLAEAKFGVKARLQNDANASALAEWKFGAARGYRNVVFMTFGTGLGAGLILDGKLYEGTNGNAGELGHIRLADTGPIGYGKRGSFEGFCSGGGIAQLGLSMAKDALSRGVRPLYFREGARDSDVTARAIAEAARAGDETALRVYRESGKRLGEGLSVLIDILNPEAIVIGSIFTRSRELLWESAKEVIEREALSVSFGCCHVLAAELGDSIGDYAAVATAI